jgi:insulysin
VHSTPSLVRLLSVSLFVIFAGCSNEVSEKAPDSVTATPSNIIKSPNDLRDYRALKLDNGLDVMLVSDPETDKAAASVDVYVGSANDPKEFPGLAHFLEHMLFLGTSKYPDADAYQKFISEHGGGHNAFTSSEHTNYYFDINADHLEAALDRFSQQFIAPLFNAEYVEREVNAVHSEYSSKLKDDGRRLFSALKATLNDNHPYKHFAVGNLQTLKDSKELSLRDALLKFHEQYYSANTMKLVVLGKEPLDQLETWVKKKFTDIKNRSLKREAINVDFFAEGFLPARLDVQSVKDTRSLSIGFPIPSPSAYKDSQPVSYIANLIGHEGQGSLLSTLKEDELVDSLSAGSHFDTQKDAIFMVNMTLTQKGLQAPEKVLEKLFSYIDLVKKEGLKKIYFDEQVKMLEIGFNYQEKSDPAHFVRRLSGALQESTPEQVLFEHYNLNTYDKELYADFLNHLRPDNMLVSVSAQSVKGTHTTEWFKAPYSISKIDDAMVKQLQKPQTDGRLSMPAANVFIPDNIQLLDQQNTDVPVNAYEDTGIETWHATDTSFGTPKADLFVTLRSPAAMQSAETLVQTEILVSLFKDALSEFSYPAYLAGLNYELYNHVRGITIKISGYNDKQSILLDKILSTLKKTNFQEERFNIIKERIQRAIENEKKHKPYEQAIAASQRLLLSPSWTPDERLSAVDKTTLPSITAFHQTFFSVLDIAVLSHGNVDAKQSVKLSKQIQTTMLGGIKTQPVERSSVLNIDAATPLFSPVSVEHPDTGFVYMLQGNSRDNAEKARFMLLSQILSSDYYGQIRTEKQLGYVVFATYYPALEVPSIAFIVQSPTASGETLMQETEKFLEAQIETIKTLDSATLDRFKTSLVSRLSEQDNNLYERSNRYWREIDRSNTNFDTREQLIQKIEDIDHEALISFYTNLLSTRGDRLVVYTTAAKDASAYDAPENYQTAAQLSEQQRIFFPHY